MIENESLDTHCDMGLGYVTRLRNSSIRLDNSYHKLPVDAENGEGWSRVY